MRQEPHVEWLCVWLAMRVRILDHREQTVGSKYDRYIHVDTYDAQCGIVTHPCTYPSFPIFLDCL